MAVAKKRTGTVDKWKLKSWYVVIAPDIFQGKEISEIVATEDANLLNRVIGVSLMDLTGNYSQTNMFTTLFFRIKEVKGKNAYTKLIGHEISPSYLKTFARRNRSIVQQVTDVKTKDDDGIRIKAVAITGSKVSKNTEKNIRNAMLDEINKAITDKKYEDIMQEIINSKLAAVIYNRIKSITPIKKVEIRKTELKEKFI